MATHNCNHQNQNCGCNHSYTVTAPCPPACPEVFNAQCIVYTGTDLVCGDDTVINRYDYMDTVVTKLVNYFCTKLDAEERWFELIDFAATSITPTTGIASLSLLADPASVGAGGSGISAILSGTGAAAQYDLLNTDPGTAQLIFGIVDCNNDGGPSVGTAVAASNTDTLTLVGGVEISLSVPSPNTVVIDWAGVTIGAGLSGTGLSGDPLINAANIYESITGDAGTTTASSLTDTLTVSGGKGITTDATVADTLSIVADVAKFESETTTIGAAATVPFIHNLNTNALSVTVAANALPLPYQVFTQGIDYSIQIDNANQISITDLSGGLLINVKVTVIG